MARRTAWRSGDAPEAGLDGPASGEAGAPCDPPPVRSPSFEPVSVSRSDGSGSVSAAYSARWRAIKPSRSPSRPWPDHTTAPVEISSSSIAGA